MTATLKNNSTHSLRKILFLMKSNDLTIFENNLVFYTTALINVRS